jgi:glycine/D-amino acid oxidase-like deaminating enzyme
MGWWWIVHRAPARQNHLDALKNATQLGEFALAQRFLVIISWRGFSGHGLMHAPGCGRAIAELILDGSYQTIDLSRFGWARIAAGRQCAEKGIV